MAIGFPGESDNYRYARNTLLEAEAQLRSQLEAVAALRRQFPLGGRIPEDYLFEEDAGGARLSQLFKTGQPTLLMYNFMYGPAMKEPARYARRYWMDSTAPRPMLWIACSW